MTHNLHNVVYARLDAIANAEKITRKELAALSRELLTYVPDTHDIDIVNRLIGVLTPVNRKVAILFFTHFLPWQVEKQDEQFSRFGKMKEKQKQIKRHADLIAEFLKDENQSIWTWADQHIEVEQKQINLADGLEKALGEAINGVDTDKKHGDPLSKAEVLAIVMKHITSEEMLDALSSLEQVTEQEQAA